MTGEIDSLKTAVKDRELTLRTRTDERDRLRGKVDDVHTKIRDLLNTTETTRSEWARDTSVAGLKADEGTR